MHPITPYGGAVQPFAHWDGRFSAAELDELEALAMAAQATPTVGDAGAVRQDGQVRRSRIAWLSAEWLFERLGEAAARMNADFWNLDLTGFGEALQLARYDAPADGSADAGDHYGWHQDYGLPVSRKLSLVLQLTDPAAYDGGELEVMAWGGAAGVGRVRGRLVAFPAWQLHRVTPVTRGVRCSLVAWVSGPRFR